MRFSVLAEEIIDGRRLAAADREITELITGDLEEMAEGADRIRQSLCGDRVDLCSIVNGRGGKCSENCKFCAQSAHHRARCLEYGFLDKDEFVRDCGRMAAKGVDRYSIVTAGRTLEGQDLEKAIESYQAMHTAWPDMILCASHGLVTEDALRRMREAGVSMYHTNVETSERFFPQICTTHTYADKKEQIRRAKAAGMTVCSGGIFGMGETWQDRIDMALLLAQMEIDSIPLNFLIPVRGTPLEHQPRLSREKIVRIVALFRYLNPTAYIRLAAGRSYFDDGGEILFRAGANATLTGDMLTTVGNNTTQDRAMLTRMGRLLKAVPEDNFSGRN